jgi:hypothetical protein
LGCMKALLYNGLRDMTECGSVGEISAGLICVPVRPGAAVHRIDRPMFVPAGPGRWPQLCDRMVNSYHLRRYQAAIGFVRY